jgi:oxygen-dependent protoporphyrinogen oxidase
VERRQRLGGVMMTDVVDGCVIEGGPDSFLAAKPAALELIRELGLEPEVIGSNDARRITYIVRGGRLVPMPDGLMMMVPTKVMPLVSTPLLGWGTKLRMAFEYFRRPPASPPPDRSVADFIAGHYGQETVDYLAEPLLAGVYGGDPERMSVNSTLARFVEMEAKYGSLTRATLAAPKPPPGAGAMFRTLKRGMGSLVDALRPHAPHVLQGEAEAVEQGRGVRVGGQWIAAHHVVLACPAYEAAKQLAPVAPDLAALLEGVEYTSSLTMAFGFLRSALGHPQNGFGFLVPRKERRALVACTWVGTKFDHRVPDTHALIRCFLTEDHQPDAVLDDLRRLMGIRAEPAFVRTHSWKRSMAQYHVGHAERLARIHARTQALPWLQLAGNAYEGIGVPDCIRLGKLAAERIAAGQSFRR